MADPVSTINIDLAASPGTPLQVTVYMDHSFSVGLGAAVLNFTDAEIAQLQTAVNTVISIDEQRKVAELQNV